MLILSRVATGMKRAMFSRLQIKNYAMLSFLSITYFWIWPSGSIHSLLVKIFMYNLSNAQFPVSKAIIWSNSLAWRELRKKKKYLMGVYVYTCMCRRIIFHLPIYLFFSLYPKCIFKPKEINLRLQSTRRVSWCYFLQWQFG